MQRFQQSTNSSPHCTTTTAMTTFRKYHGLGNDFVLIDNRHSATPTISPTIATEVCDRHTGVGADGVIFMLPPKSTTSDISMRLFNSDGSEPEMCGNGIRCLAKFADDLGVPTNTPGGYKIDTGAGVIMPKLLNNGLVCVDMGPPILTPSEIPTTLAGAEAEISVDGEKWVTTPVSMGNPHSVIFVDRETFNDVDSKLDDIGPSFENHAAFPARTNTEFVVVENERRLVMSVWERGAGRTRACGTGACAVVVAAVLTGRANRGDDVTVVLPGGELIIRWDTTDNGSVFMTGPAELVFSGELNK